MRTVPMFRRLAVTAVTGALALTALVAPAAEAAPGSVYKLPHSETLYQEISVEGTAVVVELTYDDWAGQGFPGFRRINPPRAYAKVSFSPVVYAVTDWPGAAVDLLPHAMSLEEWVGSGQPTPVVDDAGLLAYTKFSTSAEVFAVTPAAEFRKLTYPEWQSLGFPAPLDLPGFGFAKLTWSDGIALFLDEDLDGLDAAEGILIGFEEWAEVGFPTPAEQSRFEGDVFYLGNPNAPEMFYEGPTYEGPLSYEQWQAAGFPPPQERTAGGTLDSPDAGALRAALEEAALAAVAQSR
jgi:hypothetical protein